MRVDKAQYYSELAVEVIAAEETENTRKMYCLIKKLSGIGPTTTDLLKDESGHIITDGKEKIETWANHFQNLLNILSAKGVPIAPTALPLFCVSSDPHPTTKSYLLSKSSRTTKREVLTAFTPSCFTVVPHHYANRCRRFLP